MTRSHLPAPGPEFFQAAVEMSPDAVFLADGEGRYLYVNEAASRITGRPADQMLGRHLREVLWDPDDDRAREHFARLNAEGRAIGVFAFRRLDGEKRWCRVDAFRIGEGRLVGLVRDITDQRRTAAALERERQRLARAQEVADVGWWEFHLPSRRVEASDVARRIYGLPDGAEFSMEQVQKIPLPRYREQLDQALHGLVEHGEPYEQEFEILRADDGDVRSIYSLAEYDPETGRVFGILQDITRLRRTETALQESEERLRQAQKMEAVGRLAGGVAHDFNNLLTPILGFTELVQQSLPPDAPQQADLATVARAADRARDLTSQLLAFGRKQLLEMRTLDLNEVITESESMLRRLLREDIAMTIALAEDLRAIRADLSQIHNVLINLVVNAADAMPDGGTLTIETANVQLESDHADRHPGTRPGPHVMLAVSDTGTGMAPETQAMVFEPFFTTKGLDRGTGLGLATVHGIVRQHAGSIYVYSEPGQGSTFKVYLPQATGPAQALPDAPETADLHGTERILVVEDDDAVRELAEVVLRERGYAVVACGDPGEAIEHARRRDEPCDLLLTDVVMPRMNGADLHRELAAIWPGLPVLFMSGYTANVIAHHGILADGVEFLPKPFTPRSLCARVRRVLDGCREG